MAYIQNTYRLEFLFLENFVQKPIIVDVTEISI